MTETIRTGGSDGNWWSFSISDEKRRLKIQTDVSRNTLEVNPNGQMDYTSYIGLDELLACQVPSSQIPDERVFIIVHQLFELIFKLMIFDLAVIARTFEQLLQVQDDSKFFRMCMEEETFWRPALTASGRIELNSKTLLGNVLKNLNNDATFSSKEFYFFRPYLPPASGFQTAQYRLIQRAFGKSNLLTIRLFPSDMFREKYEGKTDAAPPIQVVDQLILREGGEIATPAESRDFAIVARLDALSHQVLSRLPDPTESGYQITTLKKIRPHDVDDAVEQLESNLANHRKKQGSKKPPNAAEVDAAALKQFREDIEDSKNRENERRELLTAARAGAVYLRNFAPWSHLSEVLKRLVTADKALHGKDESFLKHHFDLAVRQEARIERHAVDRGEAEQPTGTGGGGTRYLLLARQLIDLFPALVAFRELGDVHERLSFVD
ncbi:MAG: hypothetical protein H7Z16_04845 [Pyrinomonadaceae bacterium]|nr:hypothetical protein [Pyrinomonadaceae bacterium]